MTLGAYFAGELESVDHLLLSLADLLEGMSAFKSHLKVEAEDFEDLFVGRLKANELLVAVQFAFALHN